jgi:hypothetical protein
MVETSAKEVLANRQKVSASCGHWLAYNIGYGPNSSRRLVCLCEQKGDAGGGRLSHAASDMVPHYKSGSDMESLSRSRSECAASTR